MLRALKELFDAISAPTDVTVAPAEHRLQLATAVLLVEVMRAEPVLGANERLAVVAALRRTFALAEDELSKLVELAEQTAGTASDFFQFTSVINDAFDQNQKGRIVQYMWQVAYADGHLDANESHLISKLAGLLNVTHGEYIAAKLRAQEQGT